MMKAIRICNIAALCMLPLCAWAQASRLTDSITAKVEAAATVSSGDNTPLWLNANRYGLSSLDLTNGYVRAAVERPVAADSTRRWGVGYALDMAATQGFTSRFVVQQAFIEARWLHGTLTVGSKERPIELKNDELSTGAQTLGKNARPVPEVRLGIEDYWTVPCTREWLQVKGHVAYGMTTDNAWQRSFAAQGKRYTENTMTHSKAGYMRIGKDGEGRHVSVELGLEMGAQFGGRSFNVSGADGVLENKGGLKGMLDAFIPGGSDPTDGFYKNVAGNTYGSWLARVNLDYDKWYLGLYCDHYFEDHSGMFFLDYDGYGTGDEWDKSKKAKFRLYDFKDMQVGIDLKLKRATVVNNVLFEYIYSKYQSSPIYHDHTVAWNTHIGGLDNYYNHNIFTGRQHWGQAAGNPLYLSPIYNTDGTIEFKANRMYAFHLAVAGDPVPRVHYRVMGTWEKAFGTYYTPFVDPRETFCTLAEAVYTLPCRKQAEGAWTFKAACGADWGTLMGDNCGAQLTVARMFHL